MTDRSETHPASTGPLRPLDTIELDHSDLARLLYRDGLFWQGCGCPECVQLVRRIARTFPDLGEDIRKQLEGRSHAA